MDNLFDKAFDTLDEEVQRIYTRAALAWEKGGHSRFSLAKGLNYSSFGVFCAYTASAPSLGIASTCNDPHTILELPFHVGQAGEVIHEDDRINESQKEQTDVSEDGAITLRPSLENRYRRMGFLICGAGLMAKGIWDAADYAIFNNPESRHFLDYITHGYELLAVASSIYIRNADPNVLKKDSLLKRTKDSLTEKLQDMIPQPLAPVPVPVSNY